MTNDSPRAKLGDLESRVMKVVWKLGRGSVHEVRAALTGRKKLAYTTVLTTLRNLEKKGYVGHEKDGRRFVYFPEVLEGAAGKSALTDLLERFFDGSKVGLASALFSEEELSPEEFEQLRAEILSRRREEEEADDV